MNMKLSATVAFITLFCACILAGCGTTDADGDRTMTINNFESSTEGWEGAFADYPIGDDLELFFERSLLPEPLDQNRHALLLGGTNTSDDLFMFLKREIAGLEPGRRYRVYFSAILASEAPQESIGIGGSPGASVFLKAGAVSFEPKPVEIFDGTFENGFYGVNFEKGNQSEIGEDAVSMGTIGHDGSEFTYRLIERSSAEPIEVTSSQTGSIWVWIGTDSGFEGRTELFYDQITIELTSLGS
jgi:hypothetical protein